MLSKLVQTKFDNNNNKDSTLVALGIEYFFFFGMLIDYSVEAPSLEFDARLDAQWRSYTYVIHFSRQPCVFLAAYTYRIYDIPVEALDLQVMQQVVV